MRTNSTNICTVTNASAFCRTDLTNLRCSIRSSHGPMRMPDRHVSAAPVVTQGGIRVRSGPEDQASSVALITYWRPLRLQSLRSEEEKYRLVPQTEKAPPP